ncbi:MAG: hemerythrin domain-containing protein, partial [Bacteroidales bacterium]
MSEFTNRRGTRLIKLMEVSRLLLETGNAHSFIVENKEFIDTVIPTDFITLFDELIKEGYDMERMKILTNKVLNIFRIPIETYKRIEPKPDSFLNILEQNNREMVVVLDQIRPYLKAFLKDVNNKEIITELIGLFSKLEAFAMHYTIKENVLFPVIERNWKDYRCIQIMWSFHDDIRRNIKTVLEQLSEGKPELKRFNRCVGDIFFNMLAIKFREEHILFPYILDTIDQSELDQMNQQGKELGYPYIEPLKPLVREEKTVPEKGLINLGTGKLTPDQIKQLFDHLPVDITYVDENDRVQFF